jgi:hypothetical protein
MSRLVRSLAALFTTFTLGACAAHAAPLEHDVVVSSAGPASPLKVGTACVLRMQPAWRRGVNCQVLLRCGEVDLFGGKRVGGYARCETDANVFLSADDDEPLTDGDPALHVDVATGRLAWRGSHDGESASLRVRGAGRRGPEW